MFDGDDRLEGDIVRNGVLFGIFIARVKRVLEKCEESFKET